MKRSLFALASSLMLLGSIQAFGGDGVIDSTVRPGGGSSRPSHHQPPNQREVEEGTLTLEETFGETPMATSTLSCGETGTLEFPTADKSPLTDAQELDLQGCAP
jgi:hypothetical protein